MHGSDQPVRGGPAAQEARDSERGCALNVVVPRALDDLHDETTLDTEAKNAGQEEQGAIGKAGLETREVFLFWEGDGPWEQSAGARR